MDSAHLKTSIFKQYFKLVALCWHYAAGQRRKMVLFYVLITIANCIMMASPWVLGQLINDLQRGGDNILSNVIFWLSIYAGLTFFFWVFHGPARIIERILAFDIKKAFNLRHYDMAAGLPLHWHHDHHTGNTINRLNKASSSLYEFAETQFIYLENIIRFVIVFIMIGWLNLYISLGLFVFTFVMFYVLTRFDMVLIRKTHEVNEREHIYSSVLFDFVSNMANVVMFNLHRITHGKLKEVIEACFPPLRDEIYVNEWKWFFMTIFIALGHFAVLYTYIAYHLSYGIPLMLGSLVMIFQYMLRLDSIFVNFAAYYARIVRYFTDLAAVEPITRDFDQIGMQDDDKPALQVSKGQIDFSGLSFSYKKGAQVFKDLDLHIKPGERIGLVGPSGAGKTTLVYLLLRFYDALGNQIMIDGQNIFDVSSKSLRDSIGIIPQDTSLFEATLMENIRYGHFDAADEGVIESAKKAHAHEFIDVLPARYETLVGERGIKLSGGQRQRIAIARAILKNAPILILDEATSALDSESERFIQESLKDLMQGKTVIAIAHRLSTIAHMDRLVVMDEGRIVEEGTHAQLLEQDGLYARLWEMQSGGFIGDIATA